MTSTQRIGGSENVQYYAPSSDPLNGYNPKLPSPSLNHAHLDGVVAEELPQVTKEMVDDKINELASKPQHEVTQIDIMHLLLLIMALEISSMSQEKRARWAEREVQIKHMINVVENYKTQGQWSLNTGIGAGIMGLLAGFLPILGHMKGQSILDFISGYFTSLKDMAPDKFFRNMGKMMEASSKISENAGHTHRTFSEGRRNWDQHLSDLARTDGESCTRDIELEQQHFRQIEEAIRNLLQMQHEAARSLNH